MTEKGMIENTCGFVAVIGPPNAGKSTLSNALVGQKVSIVTQKAQTTRMRLRAVMMHEAAQIILVDTPGIFAPKQRLDRAMVSEAWQGVEDADMILLARRARLFSTTWKIPKSRWRWCLTRSTCWQRKICWRGCMS